MNKPTLLSVVSEWWQWSDQDLDEFRDWATNHRDEAIVWLHQEAKFAIYQRESGHQCIEDWIAYGRKTASGGAGAKPICTEKYSAAVG